MINTILVIAGTVLLTLAAVLWPEMYSRWRQRNDPPGLLKWAGGKMPPWPKGMKGAPVDREPVGPSSPRVIEAGVEPLRRRKSAA